MDIVERLRFDAARCEAGFSKGVATNIEEAAAEIERLRERVAELQAQCGYTESIKAVEIERLRAALGKIAAEQGATSGTVMADRFQTIARAALRVYEQYART